VNVRRSGYAGRREFSSPPQHTARIHKNQISLALGQQPLESEVLIFRTAASSNSEWRKKDVIHDFFEMPCNGNLAISEILQIPASTNRYAITR
jgi:hypothetical protein